MKIKEDEYPVTDINLMIRGYTIFSFVYMPSKRWGTAWQLVFLNKKKEHNF